MAHESSIELANKNWVARKSKYEKSHKYAGSPDLVKDREIPRQHREVSPEPIETYQWRDYGYCH